MTNLVKKVLIYDNGVVVERTYYPDGKRKTHHEYLDDHFHGTCRQWHPNGVLAKEANYVKDQRHGEYKEWDSEGILKVSRIYQYGK